MRHALAVDFAGTAEPSQWILADVHLTGSVSPGQIDIYWHEKGVLALFPMTADRYRVIADLGPAAAKAPSEPTLTDVQARLDERGPGDLLASNPVWIAHFRISERKVAEYRHGRTFLAGDAAHIHSPAGGQGMNTGMQDAFNLAWKLALVERGQARADALLATYSLERSKVAEQVLRSATLATEVATLRNPIGQFLRNQTASILFSFSFVRDKIRDTLGELSIHYRYSPLAVEEWSPGGGKKLHAEVHAGDRLPDAPLGSVAGGVTTLYQATRSAGHKLMLLAADGSAEAIGHLQALAGRVEAAFPGVFAALLIVPSSGAVPMGRNRCPRSSIAKGSFAGSTGPAPRRSSSCGPTDTSAIAASRPTPIGCCAISIPISCGAERSPGNYEAKPPPVPAPVVADEFDVPWFPRCRLNVVT